MTKILLAVYSLVWPLGSLLLFPSVFPYPIYYLDVIHLLFTLILLHTNKIRLPKHLAYFLLALWLSLCFSHVPQSPRDYLISACYLLRLFSLFGFYLYLNQLSTHSCRGVLIFTLVSFLVLGLTQYIFFPDARFFQYLGFDDHYYRLVGSFLDPNFSGVIFTVAFFIFASLPQPLSWILQLPALLALLLTFSRASILTFVIVFALKLGIRRLKYLLILFPLLAISLYFLPKPFGEGVNLLRTYSLFSRLDSYKYAFTLFLSAPILGIGFNTLKINRITSHGIGIDNSYLYILATSGIAGMSAFIYFLYQELRHVTRHPYFFALLSILIHSLFNNSFFYLWVTSMFFLILSQAKADSLPSVPSRSDYQPDRSPRP